MKPATPSARRFMSLWLSPAAFCLILLGCSRVQFAAEPMPGTPALGINLAGPADWNTELPLVDVFRLSRTWVSQKEGQPWGQGPALDLDERGWVKKLAPGCYAESPLCTIQGGHYPSGRWTVIWEGNGQVTLHGGREVWREPGKKIFELPAGDGFFLRLLATDPANPVRNIRVLMPGTTPETAADNPWNPQFLARWQGVACLRFMDFQETNNSKQVQWQDRPRADDATWTTHGIPVELLCDLANRLHADAWFCIPHQANDEYVRQFAQAVKEHLAPEHRAYVEYSNEVWNSQFEQHRYAAKQGLDLGLGAREWQAAWHFYAQRSVEIFKSWEEVFGGTERIVRVLASQAASASVADEICGWNHAAEQADVLAIAPYISLIVLNEGQGLKAEEVAKWNVEQLLDYVETNALPESLGWMAANKRMANRFGLKLVAYEAGQHFVGAAGAENNDAVTRLLHEANLHPRMKSIYEKYYKAWSEAGGDLLCHFSSVSAWSKWGSWGLLQFADDDPNQSPKFSATLEWARQLGQNVTLPGSKETSASAQ